MDGFRWGRLRLILDRRAAAYSVQKEALRTRSVLLIDRNRLNISGVSVVEAGDLATFSLNYQTDATLPGVDTSSTFRVNTGEYVDVYSKYRLRDTYNQSEFSNNNWKKPIGHLFKVDASDAITDLGLNWVSSDASEDPYQNEPRPYYEQQRIDIKEAQTGHVPKDAYYGIHGGTASPIVSDGTNLYLITGYGDVSEMLDIESPASRFSNWQMLRYGDKINMSVSELQTNSITGFESLQNTVALTNSYVAFEGDTLKVKPKTPIRAGLAEAINDTSVLISFTNQSRDTMPASGTFRVDTELITYTSLNDLGQPQGVVRGAEGSTAAAHVVNSRCIWVDHILEKGRYKINPIDSIQITSESTRVYNHIFVRYGDKMYDDTDADSIAKYGVKPLELALPLDETQLPIAKFIVNQYLDTYAESHPIVEMQLKLSEDIKMMDVVYANASDRSGLKHLIQVTNIDHQYIQEGRFLNRTVIRGHILDTGVITSTPMPTPTPTPTPGGADGILSGGDRILSGGDTIHSG